MPWSVLRTSKLSIIRSNQNRNFKQQEMLVTINSTLKCHKTWKYDCDSNSWDSINILYVAHEISHINCQRVPFCITNLCIKFVDNIHFEKLPQWWWMSAWMWTPKSQSGTVAFALIFQGGYVQTWSNSLIERKKQIPYSKMLMAKICNHFLW